MFQAKFFPGGNIFDAVIPSRCSYAWRSILQARDVILKGAIWQVGDGRSINIWEQRWVPNLSTSKVVSPRSNSHVTWVSELFLPNSKSWDVELLNNIFYPWEAEEISRIHVSPYCQTDAYVWPLTSNGDYSIRSAYKMLVSEVMASVQASSSTDNSAKVWKGVWRIRTPNKIRHFMWKAVKDSLPTKENLHKHQIPLDESCSLCEEYQETNLHALWLCDHAKSVWKSDVGFSVYYKKQYRSFMDLFEAVLERGSVFHVAWFSTVAWSLWQRWNKLREKQPTWPFHEICKRAKDLVLEFFEIHEPQPLPRRSELVCWCPPHAGFFKANFDAAVFDGSGLAGIRVAIRDQLGQIIAPLSQKIRLPHSVDLAEALACSRAVLFA